ncbi:MAG: sugar transferase [Oscillospiraceae bacterium]|nr:sugar transferase [Oscillospiraceae bacterium]
MESQELQLYYVENCSLLLDLKILFKTVAVVLKGKGAK